MAKKNRQACRPIRSFPADTAACETWLSDMAAKGLHLYKMAKYFAWFDRGEPMENVRFRFDPVNKDDDWMPQEEREEFLARGWEYLDTWESRYRIFRADNPAAPELHTDLEAQAQGLSRLIRKARRDDLIALGVWLAACITCICFGGDYVARLLLSLVYVDLSIIFLTLFLLFDPGGLFHLLKLRRNLRAGEPQPHPTVRRFGPPAGLAALLMTILSFAVMVLSPLLDLPNYRTVTDPDGLPYVSLEAIENDPEFERLTDSSPEWGQDYFHSYKRSRSLLVPEYCLTRQYGEIESRNWDYVAQNTLSVEEYVPSRYDPQLSITRLKLLTEGLAERVYDSFESDLIAGEIIETALSFDESVFLLSAPADDAPRTRILLRDGRTVLYVAYYGEADLTEHLNEFTALLA